MSSWSCFGHSPGEDDHHWQQVRQSLQTFCLILDLAAGRWLCQLAKLIKVNPSRESWDFISRKLLQLSILASTTWLHLHSESTCTFSLQATILLRMHHTLLVLFIHPPLCTWWWCERLLPHSRDGENGKAGNSACFWYNLELAEIQHCS